MYVQQDRFKSRFGETSVQESSPQRMKISPKNCFMRTTGLMEYEPKMFSNSDGFFISEFVTHFEIPGFVQRRRLFLCEVRVFCGFFK